MSTAQTFQGSSRRDATAPFGQVSWFLGDPLVGGAAGSGYLSHALAEGDPLATGEYNQLMVVPADTIIQYECAILRLRQELVHYKRLLAQALSTPDAADEYGQPLPVIPLDAASIRVVNSIIDACIPNSAVFREFDEEEL